MPTITGEKAGSKGTFRTQEGQLVFTRSFEFSIMADSATQSLAEILTTPGLPVVNQTIFSDSGILLFAKSKSAQQSTINRLVWTVTVEFDNEPAKDENNGGEQQQLSDPTTWIPVAEIDAENYDEYAVTDIAGAALVNSAKQSFDTPILRPLTIGILKFTQYEADTQNAYDILDRNNVVNGSTFLTKSAKTWLLNVEKATLGFKNGRRCWKIDYQLKYKPTNWQDKRLNVGEYYLNGADKVYFRDNKKNPISLGNLTTTAGDGGTTVTTLSFDIYATNSFSFLRITT